MRGFYRLWKLELSFENRKVENDWEEVRVGRREGLRWEGGNLGWGLVGGLI